MKKIYFHIKKAYIKLFFNIKKCNVKNVKYVFLYMFFFIYAIRYQTRIIPLDIDKR